MCGRLNLTDAPEVIELMQQLGFSVSGLEPRFYEPQYNIAPTDPVLVAASIDGHRQLVPMVWWLTPAWAESISRRYAMFNARSETVAKSPAFRAAFRYRRCIIPVNGFYEWRIVAGRKQALLITPPNDFCYMAGLWESWDQQPEYLSCTIVTTSASDDFKAVHNRMPVMLDRSQLDLWLDGESRPEQLSELMQPRLLPGWRLLPLSSRINNSRAKERGVLEPIGDVETL